MIAKTGTYTLSTSFVSCKLVSVPLTVSRSQQLDLGLYGQSEKFGFLSYLFRQVSKRPILPGNEFGDNGFQPYPVAR